MGFRVLRCGVLNVHGVRHHALPSKGAEESLTTARQNLFMKRFVQRGRVTSREAAPGRCGRVIIRLQHWRHRSDRSCETCSDFRQYQTTYKSNKIIGTLGGVGGLNAHNKDLINPIQGSIVSYPRPPYPSKGPYDKRWSCPERML